MSVCVCVCVCMCIYIYIYIYIYIRVCVFVHVCVSRVYFIMHSNKFAIFYQLVLMVVSFLHQS